MDEVYGAWDARLGRSWDPNVVPSHSGQRILVPREVGGNELPGSWGHIGIAGRYGHGLGRYGHGVLHQGRFGRGFRYQKYFYGNPRNTQEDLVRRGGDGKTGWKVQKVDGGKHVSNVVAPPWANLGGGTLTTEHLKQGTGMPPFPGVVTPEGFNDKNRPRQ